MNLGNITLKMDEDGLITASAMAQTAPLNHEIRSINDLDKITMLVLEGYGRTVEGAVNDLRRKWLTFQEEN